MRADQQSVATGELRWGKRPTRRKGEPVKDSCRQNPGSIVVVEAHWQSGLILPVSVRAPGGFTVIDMPEFNHVEVFTTQSWQVREKPIYTLGEALTYALTAKLQLYFGGNLVPNGAAPQAQRYAGLSQRI